MAHIGVFHCCNTFLYLNWFLHCCFSTSKLSKAGLVCLEEERVKVRMQFYYHFKISKYIKVLSLTCVNQYDLDVYTHLRDIKSLRKVFFFFFLTLRRVHYQQRKQTLAWKVCRCLVTWCKVIFTRGRGMFLFLYGRLAKP